MQDRSSTTHCTGQYGSALQEYRSSGSNCLVGRTPGRPCWWARALEDFRYPLPPGGTALHCSSCPAHCTKALWQCIVEVPFPTAVAVVPLSSATRQ